MRPRQPIREEHDMNDRSAILTMTYPPTGQVQAPAGRSLVSALGGPGRPDVGPDLLKVLRGELTLLLHLVQVLEASEDARRGGLPASPPADGDELPRHRPLTPRELQVLRLLAEGQNNRQ